MSDKKDLEKDALRLKMQKYADWYINTYKDIVHFSDFQKRHIKYNWIAESLSKFNEKGNNKSPIYYSSIWRHEVLDNLKYYLSPKRTEHIVTVFKMDRTKTMGHDRSAEFHTTFAFLYSSEENGKYEHDFVCLGPTFQSADGEYRRRFITFRQFKHVMEQFKELVAPVTEQIVKWMAKKSMGIQLESFFPKYLKDQKGFDKIQKSFLEKLDTDRLIIEIYAAVWLLEYKRFDDRTQENHLVPGYKEAMFSRQDEKFYHDVIKKIPSSQNGLFNALMEHVMPYPGKSYNPVIAGQKFIPLRVKDVEECENIKRDIKGIFQLSVYGLKAEKKKLGDIVEYLPKKLKLKAGDGKTEGKYRFYSSSQDKVMYYDEYEFKEECILLGRGGIASVHLATKFCISHDDVYVLRPNDKKININYLYHYLINNKQLLIFTGNTGGLKHLSKENINQVKIPVPSLEVQEEIIKRIESLELQSSHYNQYAKILETELNNITEIINNITLLCKDNDEPIDETNDNNDEPIDETNDNNDEPVIEDDQVKIEESYEESIKPIKKTKSKKNKLQMIEYKGRTYIIENDKVYKMDEDGKKGKQYGTFINGKVKKSEEKDKNKELKI